MADVPPIPATPDAKSLPRTTRADPSAHPPSTVRRNPPRRVRNPPPSIPPLPSDELSENPNPLPLPKLQDPPDHEDLKVFLRICPLEAAARPRTISRGPRDPKPKQAATKKKKENAPCLVVNDTSSVTLVPPPSSLVDPKRAKSEVYDGFAHVFPADSTQIEVYEKVMSTLVKDFLDGKSGLIAAMGPTGSGKTYTMFGSPRNPGVITLTLQEIFSHVTDGDSNNKVSYYFSMFEIYCERGKGERIMDLSPSGSEAFLQQTVIRGLQEIVVSSVVDAECLIARGMLKRSTFATNANSQSSRSQCVINIRQVPVSGQSGVPSAVLTFIDLAGAERERKTGNQGAKLAESGFINNTSMVFGLCLRSLMEHQKNPKKQLQKHFQNSLLTKYLRDYLEGKKRFTLILTAKPGELDYLETSCLLRQASPYMHIKFLGVEDTFNTHQKRHAVHPNLLSAKRRNCGPGTSGDAEEKIETMSQVDEEGKSQTPQRPEAKQSSPSHPVDSEKEALAEKQCSELPRLGTEQLFCRLSRAMWNVLKQYKKKLAASENEVRALKESLTKESSHVLQLEREIENLQIRCFHSEQHSSQEESSILTDDKQAECHQDLAPSHFSREKAVGDTIAVLVKLTPELHISSVTDDGEHDKSLKKSSLPEEENPHVFHPPQPPKPTRHLIPASAMLFKEFRGFDLEVENTKASETSEKRDALGGKQRSRGSTTLLRLLKGTAG